MKNCGGEKFKYFLSPFFKGFYICYFNIPYPQL